MVKETQISQKNREDKIRKNRKIKKKKLDKVTQINLDKQEIDQNKEQPMINNSKSTKQTVDLAIIKQKIQQNLHLLTLKSQIPRSQIIQQQKQLLCIYYNYNSELMEHLFSFMNCNQLVQLLQANQESRPISIRTNTLKIRRKQLGKILMARGISLDQLAPWSNVGIKIFQSKVPIGATPQYLAGNYMLQSASSLLPVMVLDPKQGQRILDMAAAPGGKSTFIAQQMKNQGILVANDIKKQRLRALQFNLMRMGISNCIVSNYDGRRIGEHFNSFDKVLLDAPCTGLGIIAKDPSIKTSKLLKDIRDHCHLQKELILSAIDCTKQKGVIVYSTCSISPLQNQQVINYALSKRNVKLVDCELQVGIAGFTKYQQKRWNNNLSKTKRIYPHVHNMDGFFVAKLRKV